MSSLRITTAMSGLRSAVTTASQWPLRRDHLPDVHSVFSPLVVATAALFALGPKLSVLPTRQRCFLVVSDCVDYQENGMRYFLK